ncbi:hypothetical protein MKX01_006086 [Papaver californicum]|nr:hypothetical protein MKX01_006086 [Papaver californicum]
MGYQNLIFVFLSSSVLISLTTMEKTYAVEFVVSNEAELGVEYCRQNLEKASNFIWQIFGQSSEDDRRNVQISMLVKPFDGAALHTGVEIQVSADYISGFSGGDIKTEITGIIYHKLKGKPSRAFVAELNAKMKTGYDDKYFNELLGKSADEVFADYKAKFRSSFIKAIRHIGIFADKYKFDDSSVTVF